MKRTLFALLAAGILATATSPPTQATGGCTPEPPAAVADAAAKVQGCASGTAGDGLTTVMDGFTTVMANVEENRRVLTKVLFPTYSTDCATGEKKTNDARVAVLWNYTDAWDGQLDRAGWGSVKLVPPGSEGFLTELQGHAYVVDYRHEAYGFGLIMRDNGLGEITFNREHFRDATGYVDWFCEKAGKPPCGGHSHGTSTDEDMRMIVRVVILCQIG